MAATAKAKTSMGCWTCKLRRKKCDETQGSCTACSLLGLICDGYGAKPAWMDGDELEAQRKKIIKAAVHDNVSLKRRRTSDMASSNGGNSSKTSSSNDNPIHPPIDAGLGQFNVAMTYSPNTNSPKEMMSSPMKSKALGGEGSQVEQTDSQCGHGEVDKSDSGLPTPSSLAPHDWRPQWPDQDPSRRPSMSVDDASNDGYEANVLMYYLEYGLEQQFSSGDTAAHLRNGWLLTMLHSSSVFRSATICLGTSYMIRHGATAQSMSTVQAQLEAQKFYSMALEEMRGLLAQRGAAEHGTHPDRDATLLATIMQLMAYEVSQRVPKCLNVFGSSLTCIFLRDARSQPAQLATSFERSKRSD